MRLSTIVPATNRPPTLERCVAAIRAAAEPPEELIVVEARPPPGRRRRATRARAGASGDVLVLPRNALVRRAYGSRRLRSVGRRVVPDAAQPDLERLFLRRDAVPPIDPEVRRLLEAFYEPDAPALERLLGRPVPWASPAEPAA